MRKSLLNNAIKSLFTSALALSSLAAPITALAQDYDSLIYGVDIEIEGLNQQQIQLYAELATAYAEIESLNEKANELIQDVASDEKEIVELQNQIAELEVVIEKRQGLLAEQARAVQVTGGSANYLNYVASSKDVSDFVGRVDVVRKMVDANKDLLDVQISDKKAVEAKQDKVEKAKEEKVVKMIDLESLKNALEQSLAAQEAAFDRLTNDLSLAQANRQALVEEKIAFEQAQAIAAQEAALAAAQAQAEALALALAEETSQAPVQEIPVVEEVMTETPMVEEVINETSIEEVTTEEVITEAPVVEEVMTEEIVTEAPIIEETSQNLEVIEGPAGDIVIEPVIEEVSTADIDDAQAEETAAAQVEADRIAAEEAAAALPAPAPSGDLLSNAAKYVGTPYVWGGKSPSGFDCSGFVQYVYKETYGKDIGGWTGAQEYAGTRISVAEAQPGDLYFWGSPGSTYHVAIATGGGNYIHASQPGTPLGYADTQWFTPQFAVRVN